MIHVDKILIAKNPDNPGFNKVEIDFSTIIAERRLAP